MLLVSDHFASSLTYNMVPTATTGRVAVVTGANKGIGFFIALQLGLSGLFSDIICACRDATRGQDAVAQMQQQVGDKARVSYAPLTLGDPSSHLAMKKQMEETYGKIDVLVNNAGFAFKNADPTPFQGQCKPTLDVNYRATVDLTEQLMDLVKKGSDPRIVNVASMSGHLSQIKSKELREQFTSPSLTMPQLHSLVDKFEADVQAGTHLQQGWGNSNYGMSKLALIAATKVWAREHPDIKINCCCPGYCKTDMTSQKGTRDPRDGAKNAVLPATMENPPTGAFFSNYDVAEW
jgi:carbonyl reductase 1